MLMIDRNDILEITWQTHSNTFCCRAVFYRDEHGGYTVFARNLPGVISEGDSLAEAIENIRDAFRESVLSYKGIISAADLTVEQFLTYL